MKKHERFIEDLIVTDEAAFHMNGLITGKIIENALLKGNDHRISMKNLSPERKFLFGWDSITGSGLVIGPLYYEGKMTGEKYLAMLNEQIIPCTAMHWLR